MAVVIASIGKQEFGPALDQYLRDAVTFDMSCVFLFQFGTSPVFLHDGYSSSVPRETLDTYMRGGYLLDPFYVASTGGHPAGLWRMNDLAPDSFFSSDFVISKEVHPCVSSEAGALSEEIGIVVPVGNRSAVTYSLMRNQGQAQFSASEFDQIKCVEPIIAAAIESHVSQLDHGRETTSDKLENEAAFAELSADRLTPSQQNVVKLILRGHSNISIANILNISEGTAKLHRHNIYRRLEISSQSELFQLFIGHLNRSGSTGQ